MPHPASFRDPSGFLFRQQDGTLLRQVNQGYHASYRKLMEGGLYAALVEDRLLVDHEELPAGEGLSDSAALVLRPRELPFVSYPYEWAFGGLKNAALLTLEIQRRALEYGMSLKDASGFNIQFDNGRPILIDTLSFEPYVEGRPWVAYGQFCRHFLAPLALISQCDIGLSSLLRTHLDGIPLDLAAQLLPRRSWLNHGLLMHLHLHARMIRRHASTTSPAPSRSKLSLSRLGSLMQSLKRCIRGLTWRTGGTEWIDYEQTHAYEQQAMAVKEQLVRKCLLDVGPATVWDLGCNTGRFSRLAVEVGAQTVAFDRDPACVERLYQACRSEGLSGLLALRQDLTNPTPALGWAHTERDSLAGRGPADMVLSLALIHHLAISNNLPLDRIADWLAGLCRDLVIEWVPKSDPQVQRLLRSREDIFPDYHQAGFEAAFVRLFNVQAADPIPGTDRVLYHMCLRG